MFCSVNHCVQLYVICFDLDFWLYLSRLNPSKELNFMEQWLKRQKQLIDETYISKEAE